MSTMSTNDEEVGEETRTNRLKSLNRLPHLIVEQINISTESQTDGEKRRPPKSPVTVQEWVDSIEFNKSEEFVHSRDHEDHTSHLADTLSLGAEASFSDEEKAKTGGKASAENELQDTVFQCSSTVGREEQELGNRRLSLLQMRDQQGSLQSDVSSQSSLSSIETLLEARRENPEEILLSLGFGGSNEPLDPLARIPKRFLKPSRVKGNSLDQFVRHQEELLETLDSGFCGYRGLSGFLREHHHPVGIVGKILEKIRETDRDSRHSSSSPTPTLTSFSEVAFSVLAANTFRNNLLRNSKQQQTQASILEPVNRQFLEDQAGSQDDDGGRRRIILGQDEFCLDGEGGLVHSGRTKDAANSHSKSKTKMRRLWSVFEQKSNGGATKLADQEAAATEVEEEESAPPKRTLTRQNSICVDAGEMIPVILEPEISKAEEEDILLLAKDKLSTYKESFELEELPPQLDGLEENEGEQERHGSALSDSSGFLDGETSELVEDRQKIHISVEECEFSKTEDLEPCLVKPEPLWPSGESVQDLSSSPSKSPTGKTSPWRFTFRPIDAPTSPSTSSRQNVPIYNQEFLLLVCDQDNNIVSAEEISPRTMTTVLTPEAGSGSSSSGDAATEEDAKTVTLSLPSTNSSANLIGSADEVSQKDAVEDVTMMMTNSVRRRSSADTVTFCRKDEFEDLRVTRRHSLSVGEMAWKKEVIGESNLIRRHSSSVTSITSVKSQGMLVASRNSRDASPVPFSAEEDEYYDLQRLLAIISGGEILPNLTRQEYLTKSQRERVSVEASALQLALEKYQQTLLCEQLALDRYKENAADMTTEQRDDLMVLSRLHSGICDEVLQLQLLLTSRIKTIRRGRPGDETLAPLSVSLIRQMSVLLHQQSVLCRQLERLQLTECGTLLSDRTSEPLCMSEPFDEPMDESRTALGRQIQSKMQLLFRTLHERILDEVQQTIQKENTIIRKELEKNRHELLEVKSLLNAYLEHRRTSVGSGNLEPS